MGVLYGAVLGLFYAVFSLPLGRLADGWIRTRLLSISIFGWPVMTAIAGFSNSFGVHAVSRLGVGIGEASSQPASRFERSEMVELLFALGALLAGRRRPIQGHKKFGDSFPSAPLQRPD